MRYSIVLTVVVLTIFHTASGQDQLGLAKAAADQMEYSTALGHIRSAVITDPSDLDVIRLAAKIYLEMEIFDTALIYSKRLYMDDEKNAANVKLYTQSLLNTAGAIEAVAVMRKHAKKNQNVETSLLLVEALLGADSLSQAELVANTARSQYPKSADAYFSLGEIYYNYKPQPVYDLAISNYEEAIRLRPDDVEAHFALAECYWKQANKEPDVELGNELFRRSLVEWNTVTQLDPKNARAWFEQGKIFYLSARYLESIKALVRYRELRPLGTGNHMSSWYMGNSYYKLNQCDSAKAHLDDAAQQIDSLRNPASLLLARCAFTSKDWKRAAELYKTAVPIKGTWEGYDAWYFGAATLLVGDTARAIAIMTEAASRDPKQCSFMMKFGLLLQSAQMTSVSNNIFRSRLANCNDSLSARIHVFIGNNFFSDSLVDSALAEYEIANAMEPNSAYTKSRLAETYLIKGDEARSRQIYGDIIEIGKTGSDDGKRMAGSAILKLNAMDLEQKKWGDIIERSKQGLEMDPNNKWLKFYMGIGYQGQQDSANACKWYKEVIKVDPDNEPAKKNLKALGC